jgi:hypothetical protein
MPETATESLRSTAQGIMANSRHREGAEQPASSLLIHLQDAFGWSGEEALEALGAYLMSSEPGLRLRQEQESGNRRSRAA